MFFFKFKHVYFTFGEKPQLKIIIFQNYKHRNLIHTQSEKLFKVFLYNKYCHFSIVSLKITLFITFRLLFSNDDFIFIEKFLLFEMHLFSKQLVDFYRKKNILVRIYNYLERKRRSVFMKTFLSLKDKTFRELKFLKSTQIH